MRHAMQAGGLSLAQALAAVESIWIHTRRQVPEPVDQRARFMLSTGKPDSATRLLVEASGLSPGDARAYIEDLTPAVRVSLSDAQVNELVKILKQNDPEELKTVKTRTGKVTIRIPTSGIPGAIEYIRARNKVGVMHAMELLKSLYVAIPEPALPPSPNLQQAIQMIHSRLRSEPVISPRVQVAIQSDYASEDWEAAGRILDLYDQDASAAGRERVMLAVLKLAKGDPLALLDRTRDAIRDYRDILAWSMS